MINEEKQKKIDFIFECEHCTESWSENLFEVIDQCDIEELLKLFNYIHKKIKKIVLLKNRSY
jgi:hypothetical protein